MAACVAVCAPAAQAATGTGAVAHDPDVAQLEAAGRAVAQAGAGVDPKQAPGTPGAPGVGDPYFPLLGNGGFNVRHYDLTFEYAPASDQIDATMVVDARATQTLARFDLDLQQLFVRRVRVNGARADFARDGQELQITPRRRIRNDRRFTVEVDYGGQGDLDVPGHGVRRQERGGQRAPGLAGHQAQQEHVRVGRTGSDDHVPGHGVHRASRARCTGAVR